jgi:hypothetical protein
MTVAALIDLAERVRMTPPEDRERLARLLTELRGLADFVREHGDPQATTCLLAAGHALKALASEGRLPGPARVHAAARDLLRTVADAIHATPRKHPAPEPSAPLPVPARGAGPELRLRRGAPGSPGAPGSMDATPPSVAAADRAGLPRPVASPQTPPPDDPRRAPAGDERTRPPVAPPTAVGDDALERIRNLDGDPLLGRILLALGHVTNEDLQRALAMHREKGMAVGECLLLIGACPPERVLEALMLQGRLRANQTISAALPSEPRTQALKAHFHVTRDIFLGEVLLGAEMITNEHLEAAMRLHHLEGVRVGEALVRLGAISAEELESGIALQRSLQSIALKTARPAKG